MEMTRFGPVLRRVESRLTVPQPARSRILLEMAADLEDLYAAYRARGLDEQEALRRAEASLGASTAAVEELVQVHRPAWERLLGRFSEGARSRWERAVLTGITTGGVAIGGGALLGGGVLDDASPFVWPVLLLAVAAFALALAVFFRLFVKQDHRQETLRSGLVPLLVLAAAMVLLAGFGSCWEIYRLAHDVSSAGAWSLDLLLPRVRRSALVLALGLTVMLTVLLAWFHLRQRALSIEAAEADAPIRPMWKPERGGA